MPRHKGPQGTSSAWVEVRPQPIAMVVEVLWCTSYGVTAFQPCDSGSLAVPLSEGCGSSEVRWEQFPMLFLWFFL